MKETYFFIGLIIAHLGYFFPVFQGAIFIALVINADKCY